jgi:hypothetical protein
MIISMQAGCLLPALILLNLFFGWMFLKASVWLAVEAVLILLFILNSYILVRKVKKWSKPDDVIDVKGEVVESRKTLK